jgi:hypothetical protein
MRIAPWAVVVAVASLASRAGAEPETAAIHYTAPAGCPAEAEVLARLGEHAPVTRVEAANVRVFDLAITAVDAGFRGALSVRELGGAATTREVAAPTCDDVVTALLLVAALAIEDRAAEPIVVPVRGQPAAARGAPERWHLAFGAGIARYAGVTPGALVGVPLYISAAHGRARGRATFDATATDDLGTTSFRWIAGRLDGCPYVWAAGRFEIAPCAGVQVGALTGKGTMIAAAAKDTRPWLAPELIARIGVRAGRARVELEATAAAPLVRDHYYIAPSTTVHEVPPIAYRLAATGAIEFW